MSDEYTCNGWCCVDCLMLLANGEGPADLTETELATWQENIDTRNAGYNLALGLLREEHECATNYTVTFLDGTEHEYRADNETDAREQAQTGPSVHITRVTPHDPAPQGDLGGECECETNTFSWSACDVCGSNLGGERHAVSFWKITTPDTAVPAAYAVQPHQPYAAYGKSDS